MNPFQRFSSTAAVLAFFGFCVGGFNSAAWAEPTATSQPEAAEICALARANSFFLLDDSNEIANVDETSFHSLINEVTQIYSPIVSTHGAELVVKRLWSDSEANASAIQSGKRWRVEIYGGLARRKEITPDGLQMATCHEIGHHLGGFPLYKHAPWAAAEGQADYFAAHSCARMLWAKDVEKNAAFRETAPARVKEGCDTQWGKQEERDLCYRIAMAGFSVSAFLATLDDESTPHFERPASNAVTSTFYGHSQAQCRLDTFFHGALCSSNAFDDLVIPGRNHPAGQGSPEAEQDMEKYSCGGKASSAPGVRRACWFKSALYPGLI
jgi:hypothetical protein